MRFIGCFTFANVVDCHETDAWLNRSNDWEVLAFVSGAALACTCRVLASKA